MAWGKWSTWGMALTGTKPAAGGAPAEPLPGVTRDGTSSIYRPQSEAEWTLAQAVSGTSLTPLFGWNCQVASGNAVVTFGNAGLAGTAGGTLAYQQAVTGWSALCIRTTNDAISYLRCINAALPDIGTTSFTVLAYVFMPASSAGDRTIMQMGDAFGARVAMDSDSSNRIVGISSPNSVNGSTGNWASVRPVFLTINRVGAIARIGTNAEVLSPALAADPDGQRLIFGGDFDVTWNAGGAGLIDLWTFTGDATQANIKSILQALGWTVAW